MQPGPTPVAAPTRYSTLTRWHLLSLDAPTVAAVWTLFIARCAGITLPWTEPAAMFLAVWMIYAADRLLDARALDSLGDLRTSHPNLEERHRFHHRHRNRFLATVSAATVVLLYLLLRIAPSALKLYALLATLLAAWMLIIHAHTPSATRRLPKELAVGLFFPAAVFIPTVARAPSLQLELLPAALLFACVCTLNCLFLYAWEHPAERARTHAHWTTRAALCHLPQLATAAMLLASAVAAFAAQRTTPNLLPALTCIFSIALLLVLHRMRSRLPKLQLRALADLVLLTPLLILPIAHLHIPWLMR